MNRGTLSICGGNRHNKGILRRAEEAEELAQEVVKRKPMDEPGLELAVLEATLARLEAERIERWDELEAEARLWRIQRLAI